MEVDHACGAVGHRWFVRVVLVETRERQQGEDLVEGGLRVRLELERVGGRRILTPDDEERDVRLRDVEGLE